MTRNQHYERAVAVDISSADHQVSAHANMAGVRPRALYVGGAGDVVVRTMHGHTVTFKSVPAGTTLPIAVDAVVRTNTTATNILALG